MLKPFPENLLDHAHSTWDVHLYTRKLTLTRSPELFLLTLDDFGPYRMSEIHIRYPVEVVADIQLTPEMSLEINTPTKFGNFQQATQVPLQCWFSPGQIKGLIMQGYAKRELPASSQVQISLYGFDGVRPVDADVTIFGMHPRNFAGESYV